MRTHKHTDDGRRARAQSHVTTMRVALHNLRRHNTCVLSPHAAAHVPLFWVDDVYVTGLVAGRLGLQLVDVKRAYLSPGKVEAQLGGTYWYRYVTGT